MKNILFIAPPAGGKGTQSELLVEKFGYVHISTGDLLRDVDDESDLGKHLNELMSHGEFAPDEIVLKLIEEKLKNIDENKPFILDGFPRNLNQAENLEKILRSLNKNLDIVIELDVPYEIGLKRVLGRVICQECKSTYNLHFKPTKVQNICDICGSILEERLDDNEESYKIRYDNYLSTTKPLIDFYKKQNKHIKIDGINNTHDEIVRVVK